MKGPLAAVITSLNTAPNFLNAGEWKIVSESVQILKP